MAVLLLVAEFVLRVGCVDCGSWCGCVVVVGALSVLNGLSRYVVVAFGLWVMGWVAYGC